MGAMILSNKRKEGESHLAPWLALLPESVGVPVFWSDQEIQQLQYPYIIKQVKEQQREWQQLYDTLRASVPAPAKPPTKLEFWWAMSCVRSRTFSGPYIGSTLADRVRLGVLIAGLALANTVMGIADPQKTLSAAIAVLLFNVLYEVILSRSLKQYAICPLIDLFNHSSVVQSEVSYNYFGDSYAVVASRQFGSGEQVYITYGAQSNDSLMQFYGFAESNNPSDTYVMMDPLRHCLSFAGKPISRARLDALRSDSLGAGLQQVVVQLAGFPPEVLQAARYLVASDAEAAAGVSAFSRPGGADQEALMAELLAHLVDAELASLATSLQEDQAMVAAGSGGGKKGGALSPAEASALAFRIEKKRVLGKVLKSMGASG